MDIQELRKWAEETVNIYNPIAETIQLGYYTQSDLTRINNNPEVLILGINPGAEGGKIGQDGNELLKGNPCFAGKSDEDIISELSGKKENIKGWDLWKKIHKMLDYSGKGDILEHIDKFVLSNMIFFGTAKEYQIPKGINKIKCAKQTLELIDILQPKVVILLGKECKKLFNIVENTNLEELVPQSVFYCYHNDRHFLSIKHTAFRYSNYELKIIGNTIGYILDHSSLKIEKRILEVFLTQSVNGRIWYLKAMINNFHAIQKIYDGRILFHEYFTTIKGGKYVTSPERIAIDLMPEENKSQYAVLVFTRQNDETKTKNLIKGVWPNEEFNPWSKDKSRHVHKVISFNESNEHIKDIMEQVLQDVKAYRDKTFPLKK